MGCSSVSDAHIYMHHVSSVRDWWKKNELGCSWDVQDAQDALKTDPTLSMIFKKIQKWHFWKLQKYCTCISSEPIYNFA